MRAPPAWFVVIPLHIARLGVRRTPYPTNRLICTIAVYNTRQKGMDETMDTLLKVSSSPHLHSPVTTPRLMRDVLIALLPALVASVILFGPRALLLTAVCVASCVLAEQLEADTLIILTAVEKVAVNFGRPDQRWLDELTLEEARRYLAEGQFAPGSMRPKVEAAVRFAGSAPGRTALITLLEKAHDGVAGRTGTRIHQ